MLHNYVKNVTRSRGVPFEHFRNLNGGTGGPACMLTSRIQKIVFHIEITIKLKFILRVFQKIPRIIIN